MYSTEPEITGRIVELQRSGYCCSQILMMMALELQGKTNWDLVRCVEGLRGGLGFSGDTCGALTGAACLMGLYAGRGPVEESHNSMLDPMIKELVNWFNATVGDRHGGVNCRDITEGVSLPNTVTLCGSIVADTFSAATKILQGHGFDLLKGRTE